MQRKITRRLSLVLVAAMAISGLAATGAVAKTAKKNSVAAKSIQAGAVTAAKIADDAITGAKVAANSLTGDDINENSLGEVPKAKVATTATTATNATTAATAASATTLTSQTVLKATMNEGAPQVALATIAPFTIVLNCVANGADTAGAVGVVTTENNTVVNSAQPEGDLDTNEVGALNFGVGVDGAGPSASSTAFAGTFGLSAGSGTQVMGNVNMVTDADGGTGGNGSCTAYGLAQKTN